MVFNLTEKVAEHQRRVKKLTQNPAIEAAKRLKDNPAIMAAKRLQSNPAIEAAKKIAEVTNRWKEILKERELTLGELSELLSELNYPPVSTDLSIDLLQELNSQLKQSEDYNDKVEVLDQFIVEVFNNGYIDEKLKIWNEMDCLKDRIHIMKEIVEAHKLGFFSLSTLAVFPQIEGVLAETFPDLRSDKGKFTGYCQEKALKEVLDTESNKFDSVWSSYYKENTLKDFRHLEPMEHLSRHALAHGADKDYGTIVNSTKSIMIFDYIITKVELHSISIEEKDEILLE